jgi:hypothetical protein
MREASMPSTFATLSRWAGFLKSCRQILEHLGVRASPLSRAPPRDPEAYAEQADFGFEAA